MRTETLIESREAIVELSTEQALALQRIGTKLASSKQWWGDDEPPDGDRSPIHCLPAADGRWRVTVANAVGLISIGDLQLVVQPKIPADHLLYLFAKSGGFPRLDDLRAHGFSGLHLWELAARWFVASTKKLLRGDLIRDYESVSDELPVIRGRTHALAVASAVYRGRLQFPCEFDEFAIDTPLNRTLKAAATISAAHSTQTETRRGALTVLAHTAEVGPLRPFDELATLDRRTRHYSDALSLARHILRYQGRLVEAGEVTAWTFLIPTPIMVEQGIRRILDDYLRPRYTVEKRGLQLPGSTLTFNPDLLFGGRLAVGDVKYKLAGGEWNRADLYQIVAFVTAYRTTHGAIVTFRHPDSPPLPALTIGCTHITELIWPTDDSLSPQQATSALCAAATAWLASFEIAPSPAILATVA